MILAAPAARADSFSLDADYTGTVGLNYIVPPAVAAYGAGGTNASAPLGLTSVEAGTEGFFDVFGDQLSFYQTGFGSMTWTTGNGDRLRASFGGQGTMRAFSGTFQVTGGTGVFSSASGGGTFSILAPTWSFSAPPLQAPAAFSIRGSVATTAVPEPGSFALLATGLAPLATLAYRRRRKRNGAA